MYKKERKKYVTQQQMTTNDNNWITGPWQVHTHRIMHATNDKDVKKVTNYIT